jgi:hypothetical protein
MGTENLTEEYGEKSPWLFRNVTKRFPILGGYTRAFSLLRNRTREWRRHTYGVFVRLLKTNKYVQHFNLAGSSTWVSERVVQVAGPQEG